MPWTSNTAKLMILGQELNLITSEEYEQIRELLDKTPAPSTRPAFQFSKHSLTRLDDLLPSMAEVAKLALTLSDQDFAVYETLRTPLRQKQMVEKGMSKTLKSKHLPQVDGLAHAMDLVPYINGKLTWDWDGCYKIAHAVDKAATQLGYAKNIRWGGAWDRVLSDFGGDLTAYKQEVELYKSRHPGPDFIDGPHFEWVA